MATKIESIFKRGENMATKIESIFKKHQNTMILIFEFFGVFVGVWFVLAYYDKGLRASWLEASVYGVGVVAYLIVKNYNPYWREQSETNA
jgi:hypothetical protein